MSIDQGYIEICYTLDMITILCELLEIRPKPSYKLTTEIFRMDSTFFQHTNYIDTCRV